MIIGIIWPSLACGLIYPMPVACGQCIGRDRETNKKHGKDYVEEGL